LTWPGKCSSDTIPGSEKMLIDGGGFPGSDSTIGEMVVAPFLLPSKIMKVDTLVLTHPEADHMSGLRYIAEHFGPKEFWHNGEKLEFPSFRELLALLRQRGSRRKTPADLREGREISGCMWRSFIPWKASCRKSPTTTLSS